MSRKYDAIIVLDSKGKEEGIDALIAQVSKELEAAGTTIAAVDNMGYKKFPHNPRHVEGGWYINIDLRADTAALEKAKASLRLNGAVYQQYYQAA